MIITPKEYKLYNQYLDNDNCCIWEIIDLLKDDELLGDPVDYAEMDTLISLSKELIFYVNNELSRKENSQLLSFSLLRKDKYPKIRQMRDVHQFDVGSHLAYCHALTIRNAPISLCNKNGFENVAQNLIATKQDFSTIAISSIFHDFFKCFRSRRPLPSKEGKKIHVNFNLPDGKKIIDSEIKNEGELAKIILPFFIDDEILLKKITSCILVSEKKGALFYKLLALEEHEQIETISSYLNISEFNHQFYNGLYLSIIDWLGKGYARYLITHRKNRLYSLNNVGILFLNRLNLAINGN